MSGSYSCNIMKVLGWLHWLRLFSLCVDLEVEGGWRLDPLIILVQPFDLSLITAFLILKISQAGQSRLSTMLNCCACWRRNLTALISTHAPRRTAYGSAARVKERRFAGRNVGLYRDPHKLASAVKKQLIQGDDNKAIQLAREGGRRLNSVVSWNHIIGHNIERGRFKVAFKVFNDVCPSI